MQIEEMWKIKLRLSSEETDLLKQTIILLDEIKSSNNNNITEPDDYLNELVISCANKLNELLCYENKICH